MLGGKEVGYVRRTGDGKMLMITTIMTEDDDDDRGEREFPFAFSHEFIRQKGIPAHPWMMMSRWKKRG